MRWLYRIAGIGGAAIVGLHCGLVAEPPSQVEVRSHWTYETWGHEPDLVGYTELTTNEGILALYSGRQRIDRGRPEPAWNTDLVAPSVAGDFVFENTVILNARFDYIALDMTTGEELWRTRIEDPMGEGDFSLQEQHLAGGQVVIISRGGEAKSIDASTGELQWSSATPDPRWSDLQGCAFYDIGPLVCTWTGDHLRAGGVYALDRNSGEPLWSHDLPTRVEGGIGAPMIDRDRIVVLAGDRKVRSWTHGGELQWTTKMADAGMDGPISIPDGTIFVPGRVGYFAVLRANDGKVLWRTHLDGLAGNFVLTPRAPWKIVFVSSYDNMRAAVVDLERRELYLIRTDQPKDMKANRVAIGPATGRLYLLGTGKYRTRIDAYDDW